ncbi:MAG: APC family permease [Gammaproteobacteria bacterium]|nr:APC family permease [Gammaproteobacteria bacterium]
MADVAADNGRANPAFGRATLIALVIANMLGAGVFTTSGFALADLGTPWWVLGAWVIGGLVAIAGALSYGNLARVLPASGGEYVYLARFVHPAAGFIAGWVSMLAGFTGAIAYAAGAFAVYALPGNSSSVRANLVASGVIAVTAALHAAHVASGARVQNMVVGLKLVLITVFCVYGLASGVSGGWQGLSSATVQPFSWSVFALTLMWISFSYSGFNAAVYIAEEVPSARQSVPVAMVVATLLTTAIYLLLNAVFVLVPPAAVVHGVPDVATAAAGFIGGAWLANAVRLVIAIALFTSVSAMLIAGPRVYARMAEDGMLPAVFRFGHRAPVTAILFQAGFAMAVVWLAQLRQLLSYLGFTLALSAAATVASLFLIARSQPAQREELRYYPWAPLVFVVATLVFAGLAAQRNPLEMFAALLTLATGGVAWWLTSRAQHGK